MSMAIGSAGQRYGYYKNNQDSQRKSFQNMASGKKLNSAADDAAGLAIAKKLEAITKGLSQATENANNMQDLLGIADSAMGSASDNLQRIRELGVQASSGIYSDSDKQIIQDEISQLTGELGDIFSKTQYNGQPLLDGSYQNMNSASNPDGSGTQISIDDLSTGSLGLGGFDVTGSYSLDSLNSALDQLSGARSSVGAQSNALDYTINYNNTAEVNQTDALSRIEDTDLAKASMDYKTKNVIQQYKFAMQKNQMAHMGNAVNMLF